MPPKYAPSDFLSVSIAARILAVAPETVRRMVARGDLKATRIGLRLRIHRASLESYIDANQVTPKAS